jgi:hypothetical protein
VPACASAGFLKVFLFSFPFSPVGGDSPPSLLFCLVLYLRLHHFFYTSKVQYFRFSLVPNSLLFTVFLPAFPGPLPLFVVMYLMFLLQTCWNASNLLSRRIYFCGGIYQFFFPVFGFSVLIRKVSLNSKVKKKFAHDFC